MVCNTLIAVILFLIDIVLLYYFHINQNLNILIKDIIVFLFTFCISYYINSSFMIFKSNFTDFTMLGFSLPIAVLFTVYNHKSNNKKEEK